MSAPTLYQILRTRTLFAWEGCRDRHGPRLGVYLAFEPRDLWVGVYWDWMWPHTKFWFCVLPCFPLRITWVQRAPSSPWASR